MSSEFRIRKLLEWCTEIPTLDYPRESPVFILNGNEWFFSVVITPGGFCVLFLKLRKKNTEIGHRCHISTKVGFKKEESLSLGKEEIVDLKPQQVWFLQLEDLLSKLPRDYALGNLMKFSFYFDDITEPLLKTYDESSDESEQALSYANLMLESMSQDFSKFLDEGFKHDVEFMCDGQTFKAHKNVLCCRSDVFASMLQSDMVEGKTGRIIIQDMEPAIFEQFLRCLYSGKIEELTVYNAISLYQAGDKYHVDSLKKYCADYMILNLNPENFCDILTFADLHDDTDFKESVIECIIKEKIPYVGEKWSDFCKGNPVLANEVLNLFCQHFQNKNLLYTLYIQGKSK